MKGMKTMIRQCFVLVAALALAPAALSETEKTWDEQGRVVRVVYDDGRVVDYRYDEGGSVVEQQPETEAAPAPGEENPALGE